MLNESFTDSPSMVAVKIFMPELPEVETIRRQMDRALKGVKIRDVEVRFGRCLNVPSKTFVARVRGAKFKEIGRRAKLLLVGLSNDWTIVTHLKMTGKFLLKDKSSTPGKHTHIIFHLASGRQLFFDDVRKFGYLKLVRTDELGEKIFAKEDYGPEPLERGFTFQKFQDCIRKRSRKKIKPLLMEPTCIAGIGNIYADEACWFAKVRPTRKVASLSEKELNGLYRGLLSALTSALQYRGTSADNYRDLYDVEGENVSHLKAYGRGGEPCRRCRTPIKKIRIGSRSAHYCPKCQR